MQKHIIGSATVAATADPTAWLDLERLARVELTSEDPAFPIEAAFAHRPGPGWRAGSPGRQVIRLIFHEPQTIGRIRLVVREASHARTQEFVLRTSSDGGQSFRELVRQQYTFSPPGTVEEVEDYQAELGGVNILELQLSPEIGGAPLFASLAAFHVA